MWKDAVKTHAKRARILKGNFTSLYIVIWDQGNPVMQTKVKEHANYDDKRKESDC